MDSYPCPDFKDLDFSKWSWTLKQSKKASKTQTMETTVSDDGSLEFVVRGLVFNYPAKPASLPINKTRIRDGDAYTHGAYSAWEPLQVSAHLSEETSLDADLWKANGEYESTALKYLWDNRVEVFVTHRPSMQAELSGKRFDYARVFSDIGAPRDAPPDAITKGIDFSITGWGDSIDRAVVVYTGNSAYPERIGWATYLPKKAGPVLPSETQFWLVVKGADGKKQFINEVPWTEDGKLNSDAPIKRDEKGGEMWRKVGPSDIAKGSVGDAVFKHRALTASVTTGTVNKKIVAKAVYFSLPESAFAVEEEEEGAAVLDVSPPPEAVASRASIKEILAAARTLTTEEPAPASAEVAVSALRTPEGKSTKPSTVPVSFERASKPTKRGRE